MVKFGLLAGLKAILGNGLYENEAVESQNEIAASKINDNTKRIESEYLAREEIAIEYENKKRTSSFKTKTVRSTNASKSRSKDKDEIERDL